MKIVFAGPSIHGLDKALLAGCVVLPPARRGDILRAVSRGVEAIGLIDGVFESAPSVWHKEILFALASGVRVLGAASIGALRAAECHVFGMEGIGAIFEQYRSGERVCDADVALVHAPPEFDYAPLTEALADIEPAIGKLSAKERLSIDDANALLVAARRLHFKQRTWNAAMEMAGIDQTRRAAVARARLELGPGQKQRDAIALLAAISHPPSRPCQVAAFEFSQTAFFDQLQKQTPLEGFDQ